MTDQYVPYEPFYDFWGDFINGFAVVVIATRIKSNNSRNNAEESKYAIVIDDIIIFSSFHAANLYYLILKCKSIVLAVPIIMLLFFFNVFHLYYMDPKGASSPVIDREASPIIDREASSPIIDRRRCFISLFSVTNSLLFIFCSSLRNSCVTSYNKCAIHIGLKKMKVILLALIVVLEIIEFIDILIIRNGLPEGFLKRITKKVRDFRRMKGYVILFMYITSIALQAVCNGYLLSESFWMTKFSTALATMSIIRLLDIYDSDSGSLYRLIFS
ncbi:hypothetical protein C1645_736585 [Glomus cerebriforme]|uniref:Uncharacterized protein n=1 Tax=Glomus cerebriforme TaxID=658196 RepID=A0A397T2S8_9GLOM|nr:hypothetical protein C1645_736585 [Glomus cerebriforme]